MKKTKKFFISIFIFIMAFLGISAVLFWQDAKNPNYENRAKGGYKLEPDMYIYGGENEFGSGGLVALSSVEEPLVRVRAYNISGNATVDLYKAPKELLFDYLIHDQDNNQTKKEIDETKLEFVTSFKQDVGLEEKEDSKLTLPIKGSGLWFLKLTLNEVTENAFVLRSKTGIVVKESDDKLLFWAQDFETRRSVSGGTLLVYNLLDKKEVITRGSFDKDGIAFIKADHSADIAAVERGEDLAIVPINLKYMNSSYRYENFKSKVKKTKYFTFTDRPLYQPGDTVYFKSILRDDDDAQYSIPKGKASVSVADGWGREDAKVIFEKKYDISLDGTISGELALAGDIGTGEYVIRVNNDLPGLDENIWDIQHSVFQVEYYQKPEYHIGVETDKSQLISGDKGTFTVKGAYFSGFPLAKKEVKYAIYSSNFYEYDYLSDRLEENSDQEYSSHSYWNGNLVEEGVVELNEQGEAHVSFKAKIPESKSVSQIFSIEAEFQDESGIPVLASKNLLVRPGEFGIYKKNKQYGASIDEPVSLSLVLSPYNSGSVGKIPLSAKIKRTQWIKVDDGTKYGKYEKKENQLGDIFGQTDENGEAILKFTPDEQGSYEVAIEIRDSKDNLIKKKFYFWVSDRLGYYYEEENSQGINIKADKEKYSGDDVSELTISSQISDRDILLTMERDRVRRFQVVRLEGNTAKVKMALEKSDLPNIFASVSSFSDTTLDQGQVPLSISTEVKKLRITNTPDKEKYGPGDTVSVDIRTVDWENNPVSANVALWMVDKSISELSDKNNGDVFKTFWSERYNDTEESHSLDGITVNMAEMGGGGGDEGRTVFKDSAYWNPDIVTDKNGYAKITFTLPDNLTTWAIASIGSTKDTSVGDAFSEVVVSKNIVVRPILPNILRVGDSITLGALVHNFTDKDEVFDIKLSFDSGRVEDLGGGSSVQVGAGNFQEIFWKVYPNKVNESSMATFSATSMDDEKIGDAVTKEVPVKQFGFWEDRSYAGEDTREYEINFSQDADNDKSEVRIALAGSLVSSLPSAMEYLVEYPYGCVEQTTSRFVPAVIAKKNANLFPNIIAGKEVDKIIEAGIKRLSSLQNEDGGWSWWSSGKSNPYVTAYVLEYLLMARDTGMPVSEEMISGVKDFFLRDTQSDSEAAGSYYSSEDILVIKTYALTLLGVPEGKEELRNFESLNPDILAMAVMANTKNGFETWKNKGLEKLLSSSQQQGDKMFWNQSGEFESQDASTALAIRAIMEAQGDHDTIARAARYLTQNRKNIYWSNTFATAQVVRTLTEFSLLENEANPNYSFKIKNNGQVIEEGNIKDSKTFSEIIIPAKDIKEDRATISFEKEGAGKLYTTAVIHEFHTDRNMQGVNNGLSITRKYFSERGKNFPLRVGDVVDVELTVTGAAQGYKYAVVEDQLPSGMVPVNLALKNEQHGKSDAYYSSFEEGREVTENGIILSFSRLISEKNTYTYKARVISEGEFIAPPAKVALMYSPEVYGLSSTQQVSILPKGEDRKTQIRNNLEQVQNDDGTYWKIGLLLMLLPVIIVILAFGFLAYFKRKHEK